MNGRVNAQRGLAPKNRVVQCAVQLLLFCALNNGAANAGLSGGNANNGVGNANWNIGGWNSENSYYFCIARRSWKTVTDGVKAPSLPCGEN